MAAHGHVHRPPNRRAPGLQHRGPLTPGPRRFLGTSVCRLPLGGSAALSERRSPPPVKEECPSPRRPWLVGRRRPRAPSPQRSRAGTVFRLVLSWFSVLKACLPALGLLGPGELRDPRPLPTLAADSGRWAGAWIVFQLIEKDAAKR